MAHQLVHLFEGTFIEEQFDALARRQLALFMLPLHALFPATRFGFTNPCSTSLSTATPLRISGGLIPAKPSTSPFTPVGSIEKRAIGDTAMRRASDIAI